jgi:hypothetical protein
MTYHQVCNKNNMIGATCGAGTYQMIKDMVTVSESTNWSTISSTSAKYKALRCRVDSLDTTNAEYKEIKQHIIQSLKQFV